MKRQPIKHLAAGRGDPDTVNLDRWKDNGADDSKKKSFSTTFNIGAHVYAVKNLAILQGHLLLLMVATQFLFRFPPSTAKVGFYDDVSCFPKTACHFLWKSESRKYVVIRCA